MEWKESEMVKKDEAGKRILCIGKIHKGKKTMIFAFPRKEETKMSQFHKAERKKGKLRLAIAGPAGSGKTYSALLIALGLGGRIAMIDTERGSGELYDHLGEYDACTIHPPFEPRNTSRPFGRRKIWATRRSSSIPCPMPGWGKEACWTSTDISPTRRAIPGAPGGR